MQVCEDIMQNSSEWIMFRDEDSSSVFMRDSSQWVSIESPRTLIKKVGKETIFKFWNFTPGFNFEFVLKVRFVQEEELAGVRIIDLMDDDVSGDSCGTGEYPLLRTINYALRNNKTRTILTKTEYSGILSVFVAKYHNNYDDF
jgi:hypothetical protein